MEYTNLTPTPTATPTKTPIAKPTATPKLKRTTKPTATPTKTPIFKPTASPKPKLNEIDEMIFSALAGKPTQTPTLTLTKSETTPTLTRTQTPTPTPTTTGPCSSCSGSCTWRFAGNCEGYVWEIISRGCNRPPFNPLDPVPEPCPCYCKYPPSDVDPVGQQRYDGGSITTYVCSNIPMDEGKPIGR